MSLWLRLHCAALGNALSHIRRAPGGFFLNVMVVAISLSLPFAGLALLDNIKPLTERLSVEPEISIFLAVDLPRAQAIALKPAIEKLMHDNHTNGSLEFVARETALDNLKQRTGMTDAIAAIGRNPLPDAYILRLTGLHTDAEVAQTNAIAEQLRTMKGVDSIQIDSAWLERLAALLSVFRLILMVLAITLGVVVVAVIFNTVRLQVMTQREEIIVAKLVGATDSFIHRPFFYTGALLGLSAGLVAIAAVTLSLAPLNRSITALAHLYASEFQLTPLSGLSMTILLIVSAGLGLLGSLLSVRRHLAAIQ
jgi:cell division transport system permease protein